MQKLFRIGQIVPSSNTTMETEIPATLLARQQIRPERFTFHWSRMWMRQVVKEELAAMDAESDRCAVEPSDARVDVLGYKRLRSGVPPAGARTGSHRSLTAIGVFVHRLNPFRSVLNAFALVFAIVGAAGLAGCGGGDDNTPMVIIDSDFNTMGDDGQAFAMAAQLAASGQLKLLGLTIVSGNGWSLQEKADALKAVERMGVQAQVGVYGGANYPLHYDVASIRQQQADNPNGYFGAWMRPEPTQADQLVAPPDGFATSTALQSQSAVDFLIASIKAHPGRITILEIGPPTNLALALQKAPDIAPLIKQIIYMGGAMAVPGNANAVGELNWWFDPLAVRTVLQTEIPQTVIPLDVTNTVSLDQATYDRIANDLAKQTPVTRAYATVNAGAFGPNTHIYDTLTIAYLLDPAYAKATVDAWLDIDTADGADQGHVRVYTSAPPAGASPKKIRYVTTFDNARFFTLYVDLLTRPVPVKLP